MSSSPTGSKFDAAERVDVDSLAAVTRGFWRGDAFDDVRTLKSRERFAMSAAVAAWQYGCPWAWARPDLLKQLHMAWWLYGAGTIPKATKDDRRLLWQIHPTWFWTNPALMSWMSSNRFLRAPVEWSPLFAGLFAPFDVTPVAVANAWPVFDLGKAHPNYMGMHLFFAHLCGLSSDELAYLLEIPASEVDRTMLGCVRWWVQQGSFRLWANNPDLSLLPESARKRPLRSGWRDAILAGRFPKSETSRKIRGTIILPQNIPSVRIKWWLEKVDSKQIRF